jgi:phage terminase large subunit
MPPHRLSALWNVPIDIELSKPQFQFVNAQDRFPALVAGFGAGKTFAGIVRAITLKCRYPKQAIGYYLPTYDLVKKVGYEGFGEVFEAMEISHRLNKSDREIEVAGAGKIIFRSMDNPASIVGYKHADAVVDELDTLKTDDARKAWNKIIARNRQKKSDGARNTVGVATTPEGFRFVYEKWQKQADAISKGYRLIKASTWSNVMNLPEDYIPSLQDTYPANLLLAYLNGEFVNLTSGSVFPEFKRDLNASTETIQKGEALHIGMDFNVTKMAAVIYVLRNEEPHAVDEVVDGFDTPAMIKTIQQRYRVTGEEHPIIVYPDASGKNRKSENASSSDIALLQQARFAVHVNPANPLVKDRVLATNAQILKDGKRRLRVNPDKCPHFVEGLEKLAYDKNGEPDKSSGLDHIIDAGTYPIAYRWPIKRPVMSINLGMAR